MSAVLREPSLHLRQMTDMDVVGVMRVETGAYRFPWTESILRDCLRVGYHCWVCESAERIVAHAVMSVAVGEAHLLNICVEPKSQSRGIGRRLLQRMLNVARDRSADTMFLEVRASNHGARGLYESEGFGEIGRRRDYYPADRGREDAIVYAKALL